MSTYLRAQFDDEHIQSFKSFLSACEMGGLDDIKRLAEPFLSGYLSLQDDDGWTPLHYSSCSGNLEAVMYLLAQGAIWSMVDNLGNTAGDVAFSMNHAEIYHGICNEAFRAEMLRLTIETKGRDDESTDSNGIGQDPKISTASNNAAFLASKLTFKTSSTGQKLCVDSEGNGVMQGWETEIMRRSAESLCKPFADEQDFELSVLNIGFGLGIIDGFFQDYRPARHVIVEPHPDVLEFMKSQGWDTKPGVTIYPGKWQSFLTDVQTGQLDADFDVVYWDTFSEDYQSLKEFFDHAFDLLSGPHARFSWFHGLGATSRTLYDIYTEIAELDLREAGLKVSWLEVQVNGLDQAVWEGIKRRYWDIPSPYRLPICSLNV